MTSPTKAARRSGGTGGGATTRRIGTRTEGSDRKDSKTEITTIVLRIAAHRTTEFEALFEAEEIPIWDDFTQRGRFLEASLIRAIGGSEVRRGIQDYILHVVAADSAAHEEHDGDPRFRAFLTKAQKLQPKEPLVWLGDTVFERRS